ncbi:hypothetical protein [Asticcacaulis sp.]|jgi:membrane associated rhomboid family serine protease|uniref:hypothetical protein n=1 Tax=Asticcacaulis sp. TaxID=1872648 RepID=UPI0031E3AB96
MRRPLTPDGQYGLRWLKTRTSLSIIASTLVAGWSGVDAFLKGNWKTALFVLLTWLLFLLGAGVLYAWGYLINRIIDSRREPPTLTEIDDARQLLFGISKDEDKR